jgi:hypothetical protein
MAKVSVDAGICGFNTEINVTSEDGQNARIEIKTECPNLKPLEESLREADGFNACFGAMGESDVFKEAAKHCKHPGCPVPAALIKGIEVACGFALPRDAIIKIEK